MCQNIQNFSKNIQTVEYPTSSLGFNCVRLLVKQSGSFSRLFLRASLSLGDSNCPYGESEASLGIFLRQTLVRILGQTLGLALDATSGLHLKSPLVGFRLSLGTV